MLFTYDINKPAESHIFEVIFSPNNDTLTKGIQEIEISNDLKTFKIIFIDQSNYSKEILKNISEFTIRIADRAGYVIKTIWCKGKIDKVDIKHYTICGSIEEIKFA